MNHKPLKYTQHQFSTDGMKGPGALSAWREFYGSNLMQVEMDAPQESPFRCHAKIRRLPGLAIAFITSTRSLLRRTRGLSADGKDDYLIVVPTVGGTTVEAGGREVTLGTGDATVVDAAAPSLSLIPRLSSFLVLAIPAAVFAPVIATGSVIGGLIPAATDALQLLTRYIDALADDAVFETLGYRKQFVEHIYELSALTLRSACGTPAAAKVRGASAAKRRAIKIDIVQNLNRPDLSVNFIAAKHHVSTRYVRRIFENDGVTFTEFVLTQRLQKAYERLTDPASVTQAISLIAFESGFSDLSYFNKAFRRSYHATPTDVRRSMPWLRQENDPTLPNPGLGSRSEET